MTTNAGFSRFADAIANSTIRRFLREVLVGREHPELWIAELQEEERRVGGRLRGPGRAAHRQREQGADREQSSHQRSLLLPPATVATALDSVANS